MAPRRARIVVADQQVLFRQSLVQVLVSGGHTIVCQVGDSDALDRCMIENEPDIVIIDRYLPGVDGLNYARMLNALQPHTHTLILVAYEHDARALQPTAFLAGASGCMSKELIAPAYLAAVQQLMEGHLLFQAEVMRRAARPQPISGPAALLRDLTKRELEILQMVAEGMGNREIARQLNISYHTAMKHVSNIIGKLRVENRMEAGVLFLRVRHTLTGSGTIQEE
ncbi:MAG TPA: response regulator transcription factor [Roseiflexaceae bacterium]|nr:response regulator transcription factor [Roseiflexaceae bacterium]